MHTRWLVALLLTALLSSACSAAATSPGGASPAPSGPASAIAAHQVPLGATAPVDDATWALAERIAAPAYTGDSTDAFKAALAAAGIAVVADASTDPATATPEVPLTATPSPVELLDFQAHALAVQAWGGTGWTGAELDSVAPLPSDAPAGTPSLPQLLAAYAASAGTPGGAFARALLAGQDLQDPATVRFPAVVLFLFASDLATDGGRVPAPSPSPSAAVRLLPLAAGGPVVAAPAVDLGLLCSGPSGWIDAVVQNLEAALINAMPPGIVGTILGAALSWFIHIAAGLVKGLVDTFLAPVLTLIRGIAAIASGLAEQIASVMPFTVQVIAGHTDTAKGGTFFLGSDPQRGQYTAYVSAGDLPKWPDAVARCAAAARIELPDFTSKGVPVTFGPLDAPGDPLLGPTDQAVTTTATDDTGKAIWPFLTARDPGDPTGEQRNQFDYMPVAVHRPELDTLKKRLTLTLLSPLPPILQPFVGALLAPVLNGIQDRLNNILDVRGSGPAIIVFHDKAPPTPSPSVTPSGSGACTVAQPAATDQGSLTTKSTTIIPPGQIDLGEHGGENDAGQAPLSVAVGADGSLSGQFTLTSQNHFEAQGVSQGTTDTTLVETGTVGGTLCALVIRFLTVTTTACHATGYGTCGGIGTTMDLSGLVPAEPMGAPTVSGKSLTWSFSNEATANAGFGGLSSEVQSTITVTLTAP
jgi:hypothetical protein